MKPPADIPLVIYLKFLYLVRFMRILDRLPKVLLSQRFLTLLLLAAALVSLPSGALADNLRLIDSLPNGFAIYRSGNPSDIDMEIWCKLGIDEVMVLSGDSGRYENRLRGHCPTVKVVYEEMQRPETVLTGEFLTRFDAWIKVAREGGKKVLFRCNCGCHRTGRLAAYYEMKYMGRSYDQALENLHKFGRDMESYPYLPQQIRGLEDFINGAVCRYSGTENASRYCVTLSDASGASDG